MKSTIITYPNYQKFLRDFLQRKVDEGKSESHITSVTTLAREFLHYLEGHKVSNLQEVTQTHITEYFDYLSKRKNKKRDGGLTNRYLMKHREAVLRLMEYVKGVDIGQSGYTIPTYKEDKIPKEILSEDEVMQLFSSQENTMNGIRNKAILSMLYGCGLRKNELFNLNVEDIDMHKEAVRIKKTKNAHQRDVPMSPRVKKHIEEYLYGVRQLLLPEYKEEPAFLLSNNGTRLSKEGIALKVKEIKKRANIEKPLTAHRLRHAIATHLLGAFSLEEIAQFLGHKSVDSSQIYTHVKYTKEPKESKQPKFI